MKKDPLFVNASVRFITGLQTKAVFRYIASIKAAQVPFFGTPLFMETKKMRYVFGLLVPLFVGFGCSDSNVKITQIQPEGGPRPAATAVHELERATNSAEIRTLLAELNGKRGDGLDWAGFWQLLGESKATDRLLAAHRDELLSLQARSCESDAFNAYVEFLLKKKTGFEYIVAEKRTCLTNVRARDAAAILRLYVGDRNFAMGDKAAARKTATFLVRELERGARGSWSDFSSQSVYADLESLGDVLVAEGAPAEVLVELAVAFRQSLGRMPFPRLLDDQWFHNPAFSASFIQTQGIEKAVETFSILVDAVRPLRLTRTKEEIETVWAAFFEDSFGKDISSFGKAWSHFGYLRSIVLNLSSVWTGTEGIERLNRLQRHIEAFAKSHPSALIDLVHFSSQSQNSPLVLEALWLKHRLSPDDKTGHEESAVVFSEHAKQVSDPMDVLLRKRLAVLFAGPMEEKRLALQDFCRQLEVFRVYETTFHNGDDLKPALESGLKPGCYRAYPTNGLVSSDKPLLASYDSAITLPGTDLTLEAPSVDIGFVDLSAHYPIAPLERVDARPQANAIVVPVALGVVIEKATYAMYKGLHFVTVHTTLKQADSGELDERHPEKGRRGGNLRLKVADHTASFVLVSKGGAGQQGAPRKKGGKGDVSIVDTTLLSDWVHEVEVSEPTNGATKLGHYYYHSYLYPGMMDDIFLTGKRDENNRILTFGYVDYMFELPIDQREKILKYCGHTGVAKQPDAEQLRTCFSDRLAPLAFSQWEAAYREHKNSLGPKDVLDIIDAQMEFKVPEGDLGPPNPNGPQGDPGSAKIEVR